MAGATRTILPRHVRHVRPSFVMTSLIDVIFLLVIFFMVSSQIVPFSIIGLGPIAGAASDQAPAAAVAEAPVALRIHAGSVRIGTETIAMDQLGGALLDLRQRGVNALMLVPAAAATVQDVVSVLEAARQAGIERMTVLNRPGSRP